MSEVISLRISEEEKKILERIAEKEGEDRSSVARELIEYGGIYRAVKRYQRGEISVGKVAEELGITVSEAMDLLSDFGIEPDIDIDDYLASRKNLEEVW